MRLLLFSSLLVGLTVADVAIIGGGVAGLSAAVELEKNGIPYILFEAADRLGGRVLSKQTDDGHWIHLGASTVVGKETELYKLAGELDILVPETVPGKLDKTHLGSFLEMASFAVGGNADINQTEVDGLTAWFVEIENRYAAAGMAVPSMSLKTFFDKEFPYFVGRTGYNQTAMNALAAVYLNYVQTTWSAGDLSKLAMANFAKYNKNCGYGRLRGEGFQLIVKDLISRIHPAKIRLNSVITAIELHTDRVEVVTNETGKMRFDEVILAVPLGILKKDPSIVTNIPQTNADYIRRAAFGVEQKFYLKYTNPWWKTTSAYLVTPYGDQNDVLGSRIKHLQTIGNNTLLWLMAGVPPTEVANMTPEQVGSAITQHLRVAFNDNSIPEPTTVFTQNWSAYEFTLGGATYLTQGYTDPTGLSNTYNVDGFVPKIFPAGEHTSSSYWQSATGAYETGKSAAQSVLRFANRRKIDQVRAHLDTFYL